MLSRFHRPLSDSHWPKWQRIYLLLTSSLLLLFPSQSNAVELGWSRTDKEIINGDLIEFDFEKKTLTVKDSESGKKKTFPSSQLDIRGRWLLVISPIFHRSIPDDSAGSEHLILIFYFVLIPMGIYLILFWICAMAILGKISPLRAVIALIGAWLLSAFLIVFYMFMIGRHPDNATGITIFGGLVTLISASVFISIIYHKKIAHGFALIIIHSIATPIVFIAVIFLPYMIVGRENVDSFYKEKLFIPVGVLHGEEE